MTVCRACLSSSIGMYHISDTGLQNRFETISKTKYAAGDGRPESICYICCTLMRKFFNFVSMTQTHEKMFKLLLRQGVQITKQTVSNFNSKRSNFCCSRLKSVSINCSQEYPNAVEKIKKEVIEINENTFAEVVAMADILKDFDNHTVKDYLEKNQNDASDILKDFENHTVKDGLGENHNDASDNLKDIENHTVKGDFEENQNDASMNLEDRHYVDRKDIVSGLQRDCERVIHNEIYSPISEEPSDYSDEEDCIILENKKLPIYINECDSDMCSENEELPLVIDETVIKIEQQEPIQNYPIQQVDATEQSYKSNGCSWRNQENIRTMDETTHARLASLFGFSDFEKSPSKQVRSARCLLRASDFGIHQASDEETDSTTEALSYNTQRLNTQHSIQNPGEAGKIRKERGLTDIDRDCQYYFCDDCYKCFSKISTLQRHVKRVHPDTKLFKCKECNLIFDSYTESKNHMKYKHYRDILKHKCDICKKKYQSLNYLLLHKRQVHKTPIKTYTCDTCGKLYFKRLSFKYHILFVHPPESNL